MRKGKDPDLGGLKTCESCGSGSPTLEKTFFATWCANISCFCLFQTARLSSFVGAMAIGDLIKSTLGPKGMDKILWGTGRNEGVVEVSLTKIDQNCFVYFFDGPVLGLCRSFMIFEGCLNSNYKVLP
jgi:hypothetical protein